MDNRLIAWVSLATLTTAALGFAGARALATGAPQLSPLTYGGVLTDKDGKPYPTAQDVVLKFYDKVDATSPKCTAPATQAEAGTGRFSVVLPGECAQAVRDTPDLWSEATVGGGKTVLPRVHVGAVPYALEADSAKVAGSAGAASGALKAAIDGVVADVAALKKAPAGGGAPKVVDGAGVVLGTFVGAAYSHIQVFTGKGYVVALDLGGNGVHTETMYYASKGCASQPHLGWNPGESGWKSITGLVAPFRATDKSWYLVENPTGGMVPSIQMGTYHQSSEKLSCVDGTTSAGYFVPLKKVAPVAVGLPDKITAPLKIVP